MHRHWFFRDREIETRIQIFASRVDPSQKPLPLDQKRNRSAARRRKKNGHLETGFDLRTEAYKLYGVDVAQISGIETIALPLFSEVGRDMSRWLTAAHFAPWAALCTDNDKSAAAGSCRKPCAQPRLAAHSLHRSPTPLGDYLRRMKAKLGPAAAITATAHKRYQYIGAPRLSTYGTLLPVYVVGLRV